MEKKLNEFAVGEKGVVKRIEGEGKIRRRLFDMGVTPGAEIMLRKLAPLGDPVEVNLAGRYGRQKGGRLQKTQRPRFHRRPSRHLFPFPVYARRGHLAQLYPRRKA